MRSFTRWVHSLIYVCKANQALREKNYEAVAAHYSRAIEISPEDLDYYYERASAYVQLSDEGAAIADYTAAIGLKSDNDTAYYLRGLLHRKRGFLPQAISDLSRVIEITGSSKASFARACCHAEQKDYEQAMVDIAQVLAREPKSEKARQLKAWCLQAAADEEPEK